MAQAPTPVEIIEAREKTADALVQKQEEQLAEGKSFNVPADGHGAGVVPEEHWQELKS